MWNRSGWCDTWGNPILSTDLVETWTLVSRIVIFFFHGPYNLFILWMDVGRCNRSKYVGFEFIRIRSRTILRLRLSHLDFTRSLRRKGFFGGLLWVRRLGAWCETHSSSTPVTKNWNRRILLVDPSIIFMTTDPGWASLRLNWVNSRGFKFIVSRSQLSRNAYFFLL